ncbi:MAG: competence/damage-inducible protein A [Bauldia sp.]|nr:MAG: competence/damage-inducible protein A [Bauldia sp.]
MTVEQDGTEAAAATVVTAALLVIGDEILSGRTKDKNIGHIAEYLTGIGIDLREVRVVPDDEDEIVAAVNALRARYTHLLTTGGIGPTHDDITADAIARAFGVAIDFDPRAVAILSERYGKADLNEARMRMARIPEGAELIANPVSKAPGFSIGNVHVMAGVPMIMHAMLDALAPKLARGRKMLSRSVPAGMGEGRIAKGLAAVQADFPEVLIGSYPTFEEETGYTTNIVVRARDEAVLAAAEAAVKTMIEAVRREDSWR